MNQAERGYITLCKQQIEEKFNIQRGTGPLRQRDLEYLADCIEEKSGIRLSLSTLKRLWKKDYDQTPHPSTLGALASVLGYKDWQEFKSRQTASASAPVITDIKKHYRSFYRWMVLPVFVTLVIFLWMIAFQSPEQADRKPVIYGPVTFTGNKTVTQGVPSTIIFKYDVRNVVADSFFFQQSWNEQERVKLDPQGQYYANIYYYPGFHKAKLVANDSIIRRFRAHITTDGWLPLIRYAYEDPVPVYVKKGNPLVGGALHVVRQDLIAANVNIDKEFLLSYYNVREFDNTHSDNFSLDTRIICDSSSMAACPGVELVVMCEAHIFFVRMMGKGCERNIGIKMGEVFLDGASNDLSVFGRDLHKWQHLRIQVVNKQATIFLDDQPVHTTTFKNDFGKVVGLCYNFLGIGAIDYVKLENGDHTRVYEETFDKSGIITLEVN